MIRFSQNILEDIRPRAMTRDIDWGIPVPIEGWRDQPTKRLYVWFDAVIGYLSASIEWARRSGRPRALARAGGTTRRRCPTTSWARTTSPSTPRSGRPSCSRTTGRATGAAAPVPYGVLNLPTEVVSSEFLTMESKQFSSSRGVVIYVRDMLARYQPDALRYFICAAGPENSGQRLHLGGVRPAYQRRARRRLGQPGQPHRDDDPPSSFGEIPKAGELEPADEDLLARGGSRLRRRRRD